MKIFNHLMNSQMLLKCLFTTPACEVCSCILFAMQSKREKGQVNEMHADV